MKVIIAEKPSVARQIASIVGATIRQEGYLEGNGFTVTWAFGHLVGLAMPEVYGFKGFHKENLPILPEVFRLEPRSTKSGKEYIPDPKVMKQLKVIKELFEQAERIIVATDAGREGELIFRYIYQYLDCNKPFDRLWINSLTDQAIREGLRNIRPGKEYDNLYLSARARSEADWIVGINASQALAIAAGRGVWSLGRVQTPTLALVCQRYLENRDFTAQTFYRLKLHTAKDATAFSALSVDKYASQVEATQHRQAVLESAEVRIVKVESRETTENVPLLYDLTSLQRDANRRHGFPAEKTLSIAQDLYEAKLITYPRTGSRYIPEDLFAQVPALLNSLHLHPEFGRYALELAEIPLNRHSVNNDKVTDHHALLITGNVPSKLSAEQSKIYDMIAGRMLEAFSEECVKELTSVRIECAGHLFEVRATTIQQAGWRRIWHETEETTDEEAAVLPTLRENDVLLMRECDLLEKETRPRPLHTENSLLAAMETAGKELDNEAEREAMKDSGLGTPATRAAIIETLISREYIRREKRSLVPTEKGLSVYNIVADKRIADVALTGGWELALAKIATGEMNAFTFRHGIEIFATQITSELLKVQIPASAPASCPKCGSPMAFYPKVARCLNAECQLVIFRTMAGKELSDEQLKTLIEKGRTGVIKGFRKKDGNSFEASVALNADFKTEFAFEERKQARKPGYKPRK
mgnify:FL=1